MRWNIYRWFGASFVWLYIVFYHDVAKNNVTIKSLRRVCSLPFLLWLRLPFGMHTMPLRHHFNCFRCVDGVTIECGSITACRYTANKAARQVHNVAFYTAILELLVCWFPFPLFDKRFAVSGHAWWHIFMGWRILRSVIQFVHAKTCFQSFNQSIWTSLYSVYSSFKRIVN
jgi:hypothetical protein